MMVVQMHGEPGSGKSTLARAIGRELPALVIDKDSIASAMIRSGVAPLIASGAAYEAMRGLAADFLGAGHSVVLDSPCYWPQIEHEGRALAARFGADWAMVELQCPATEVERRLAARPAREGQPVNRDSIAPRPGMYNVSCERLVLDSARDIEEMAAEACHYLTQDPSPLGLLSHADPFERRIRTQDSRQAPASGLGTRNPELSS
jgi:predicted kinase